MFADIIPQFGGLIWTILAFVLALSIIVAIHEYGHYIVGRWCGIKADVFSIGFGPILFSRMDRHGTRWQMAALPLGGYVKFRGDGNAASVGDDGTLEEMTPEERAQTMTGASLWRRAATVAAGPVFNFILSILLFAGMVMFLGRPTEMPTVGQTVLLPSEMIQLEPGDQILSIAGNPIETFADLNNVVRDLPSVQLLPYEVLRDGSVIEVEATPPMPARADTVQPRSAAWDIGMRPGDVILTAEGNPLYSFSDLQAVVKAADGGTVTLTAWRDGEILDFILQPRMRDVPLPDGGFERRALIGITSSLAFEPATVRSGPIEAISFGGQQVWSILGRSLSSLGYIITGKISTCNLSGPIGIAQTSAVAASHGAATFIGFIALLSAAVGMLNLFPIPVLDGGHLVFHAYEAVRGKPPSDNAVRILMMIGIALMGALMVFALFNDLTCA
ncbi:RIP metalloprotease RseP [Jannaschia helgolandensis]|uniref:Zinc metalloprotease n=1 Tax=Jannaschia helgolandensis TaxID=188906 RepID=A0A1H7S2A9_9RHOB|nr:RIP metalloprotease RseP [Jannaschia helgolandensis]SEL66488.1 site-2 protease. Metallo peptidase. MEROPS family M50B [Jannaschia helgolandensis]